MTNVKEFVRHTLLAGRALPLYVAGSILAGPTVAQNAATPPLEEIIVSAQKRDERLQDVPIAMSSMGAVELERQGIKDLLDLSRVMPGVAFSGAQSGRSSYAIRGVSTTTEIPTVALYVDDIPITSRFNEISGAADPTILDLERVEVLRGPQGTLYGGSAMGGAIKFVTHDPSLDAFELTSGAEVATTRDGDPSFEVNGVLNLPLMSDRLAVRMAGLYRDNGGYVDRIPNGTVYNYGASPVDPATGRAIGIDATGRPTGVDPATGWVTSVPPATRASLNQAAKDDVNSSKRIAFRASALIAATDTLSILPAVSVQRNEVDDYGFFWGGLSDLQTSTTRDEDSDDSVDLYSVRVTKDFANVSLTSISALMKREQQFHEDYTYFNSSIVPFFSQLLSYSQTDSEFEYVTQELRLASSGDSRLRWTIGGFFQQERSDFNFSVFTVGASKLGIPPVQGVPDVVYDTFVEKDSDQYALFGELTYAFTEAFEVTLGARAFKIEQSIDRLAQGIFAGGTLLFVEDTEDDGITPKVSASYKLTRDNLLYTTVSKGFRAGGLNNGVPSNLCGEDLARLGLAANPQRYESDTLWNYEVGSKNAFADGRVTVNGALYFIDWKEIQQQLTLPGCGFTFTANVGEAESKGGELEMQIQLASGFTVGAAMTYTDAKITDSLPGTGARDGDRVLTTPEWTYQFNAEYRVPAFDGDFFVRGDYQYRSNQWRTFSDTICRSAPGAVADASRSNCTLADEVPVANPEHSQRGYGSANMAVGFDLNRWRLAAFVNNVTNEDPVIDRRVSLAVDRRSTLRPRTVGLRFEADF